MEERVAKMISSSDKFILVPDEAWASVFHGDCIQLRGEVLIADLIRLRENAVVTDCFANQEGWQLWKNRQGNWQASGPVVGVGFPWWSDQVTYRGEVLDRYETVNGRRQPIIGKVAN